MFRLDDVSYGALRNVSAEIHPGITAIAGPSGSGKSTLLRLLTKLIRPDAGSISFQGIGLDEWNAVELRRQVMMVPQESYIWPGSLRDNLVLGFAAQSRANPTDAELADVLQVVGLTKSLEQDVGVLSGGEKGRLSMARCLLAQQAWALWDEPTAALDQAAAQEVFHRITEYLTQRGLSLVFITHDQELFHSAPTKLTVADGKVVAA